MTTPRDLGRLAKYVKAHRMQTYSSRKAAADAVGISKDTWQRVEEGQEVRESTYAKIAKALGWDADSCIAIAEGGEPILTDGTGAGTPAAATPAPPLLDPNALKRAAFEAARAKLPASTPIGDIDAFSDELVEVLRRAGVVENGS